VTDDEKGLADPLVLAYYLLTACYLWTVHRWWPAGQLWLELHDAEAVSLWFWGLVTLIYGPVLVTRWRRHRRDYRATSAEPPT
jgi:hypothetical protein